MKTLAVSFNLAAGEWINRHSEEIIITFGGKLETIMPSMTPMLDKVINSSVFRTFDTEELKDTYQMALDDAGSKWVELTPEAVQAINLVKPIQNIKDFYEKGTFKQGTDSY